VNFFPFQRKKANPNRFIFAVQVRLKRHPDNAFKIKNDEGSHFGHVWHGVDKTLQMQVKKQNINERFF